MHLPLAAQVKRILPAMLALWSVTASAEPPPASVRPLLEHRIAAAPTLGLQLLEVSYPPGGATASHRHDAEVAVYVLEGHLRMQVAGGDVVTIGPGETFYETPSDVHVTSANASETEPARFIVFMVKQQAPAKKAAR
jgi:quercetin dioxygenase-like cupin family protein